MHESVTIPHVRRHQSLGEEIANSISHGVGLIGALAAAPILILAATTKGESLTIVAVSIFAAAMILVYTSSMIYHFLPQGRAKRVFLVFDHVAIFLLIAGTYTPFALCVLRGTVGWTLFGLIWGTALVGTITQLVPRLRHPILSVVLYLVMGWMILLFIRQLYEQLPFDGLLWVIAGGLAYTLGVIFYTAKARYSHFVWHLFTIAGTTCHFFAILWYVV
ncbi:MAG: hemolysin III family protein [Methylacidiphilales bacterium]|nr:hemolysin III family protein [Candidatus Methylacidiphilales bacterium]